MEDNTKRTLGIIGTSITGIVCGCPGLCLLLLGAVATFGEDIRDPNVIAGNEGDPVTGGIILLCIGIFLVAVPSLIAFFTFRTPRGSKGSDIDIDEPIPPAI